MTVRERVLFGLALALAGMVLISAALERVRTRAPNRGGVREWIAGILLLGVLPGALGAMLRVSGPRRGRAAHVTQADIGEPSWLHGREPAGGAGGGKKKTERGEPRPAVRANQPLSRPSPSRGIDVRPM